MTTESDTGSAFDELSRILTAEGFAEGRMFGLRCLKYRGKAVVALHETGLAFKLGQGSAAHAAALEEAGATIFDPAGGRPMKDWVRVPVDRSEKWPEWAREASLRTSA
jgi:hypothetical protein